MTFPSNMNHLMLDIESMSLHPSNALILSIGMVRFDPWAKDFGDCIATPGRRIIPSIASQLLLGREVSRSTQEFWQKQKPEAAEHWLFGQHGHNLAAMCNAIAEEATGCQTVWANGLLFDLGNVVNFYHQVTGEAPPWHYRAPRDMRTFCEETPITRGPNADGFVEGVPSPLEAFPNLIDHEPISDCIKQIYRVWEHWPVNTHGE